MTDALNRVTGYGYDPAGNLRSLLDPLNQTTGYRYDLANQLLEVTYSDGRTPNLSYSYDALGRRLGMQDGTGSSSYSCDSLGRLTQSSNGVGAQLQYGYDLKGQLTSLSTRAASTPSAGPMTPLRTATPRCHPGLGVTGLRQLHTAGRTTLDRTRTFWVGTMNEDWIEWRPFI